MALDGADKLPQPTTNIAQVKADLDEFGYGILTGLLSPDQVARTKARLDEQARLEREQAVAWLGNGGRGGNTWIGAPCDGEAPPWQAIRTLLNKGREFIDLAMNPIILEIVGHSFKNLEFYLGSTNGLIIRKGAVSMVVHTDQQFVPVQTTLPFASNVMVALTDFTEKNGATRVVPKSHLGPPPGVQMTPDGKDAMNTEDIATVPALCPAGSAIFFEGRLWHTSGACTADEPRYSISTYYVLPFMRQQDNYPASMHDEVYWSLSEEEREMFGFKSSPHGRIDPRFPGDRTNTDVHTPYIPELREGSAKRAIPASDTGTFMPGSTKHKYEGEQS